MQQKMVSTITEEACFALASGWTIVCDTQGNVVERNGCILVEKEDSALEPEGDADGRGH